MGLIFLLNGIGLIGSSAWMGLAFKAGYIPSWAIGADFLFFVGMVVPFLKEYGVVRQGFDRVERDFLARFTGTGQPRGAVETFGPGSAPRPAAWQGRRRGPVKLLSAILMAAAVLWAVDVGHYLTTHRPADAKPERITNI